MENRNSTLQEQLIFISSFCKPAFELRKLVYNTQRIEQVAAIVTADFQMNLLLIITKLRMI